MSLSRYVLYCVRHGKGALTNVWTAGRRPEGAGAAPCLWHDELGMSDCAKRLERGHVQLHVWLQAMFLLCSSKKGSSSNQLARTLGVTVKTAWFMSHRLRAAMVAGDLPPMGGEGVTVEIETARAPGCDEDKAAFDEKLRAIAKPKPQGGPAPKPDKLSEPS